MGQRLRRLWFFVSALPVPAAVGFVVVASLLAYKVWEPIGHESNLGLHVGLAMAVFGGIDLLLLAALPRLGLSYGPVGLPLFFITMLRLIVISLAAWVLEWARAVWAWPAPESMLLVGPTTVWLLNGGILALELYGLYYEPFDVKVTHLPIEIPSASPGRTIRLVQISDLHVERLTKREERVLEEVKALKPDILVLTGDYLNGSFLEDKTARRDARRFLSKLAAPLGVYAVTARYGDTPEAVREMFGGLEIRVLRDEVCGLEVSGQDLLLIGISCLGRERDSRAFSQVVRDMPDDPYSILLYHTTDLAGLASGAGVDLYLTGHTHGGQIRLPFVGALYTNIRSWKKYERGVYRLRDTLMYVSRGLGMEGRGGPRARFLCPPEIVAVDLTFGQP